MVVLEAAAIGAASYGIYKGGEAGIQKGKDCRKEFKREQKRSSQRSVLHQKTRSRSSRIAEIVQMKNGKNEASAAAVTSARGAGTGSGFLHATSFASRLKSANEASTDIDDRHRAVMETLRASRKEESKKEAKTKVGSKLKKALTNPFKKK
ncbi:unnamed protein product [Pseudo-nitzschia multistriata]|uniref:Uncharacterized protein n=1 Tax=Pseudo-nitzschia multistriata TaxID=183589 RepID=A0A448Z6B1_9STRA|nr:unnamed protein product [Pseudo-nitzschia multistriata]